MELKKLTEQFPYFQTVHVLLSLAAKKNDASLFQQSIKKTAIVSSSRTQLYNLLYTKHNEIENSFPNTVLNLKKTENTSELVSPIETKTQIKQPIDLTEQVEKEIEKEIVESFVEKEILKTHEANKKPEIEIPKDASFSDWLQFMKKNNGVPLSETSLTNNKLSKTELEEPKIKPINEEPKKDHKRQIIDKIIDLNPGSIKLNKETKFFAADNKAKESLLENEDLVTETLAKIYALQGNNSKAIRAYQILSLKYPNKSAYFASQIENLRKGN